MVSEAEKRSILARLLNPDFVRRRKRLFSAIAMETRRAETTGSAVKP